MCSVACRLPHLHSGGRLIFQWRRRRRAANLGASPAYSVTRSSKTHPFITFQRISVSALWFARPLDGSRALCTCGNFPVRNQKQTVIIPGSAVVKVVWQPAAHPAAIDEVYGFLRGKFLISADTFCASKYSPRGEQIISLFPFAVGGEQFQSADFPRGLP